MKWITQSVTLSLSLLALPASAQVRLAQTAPPAPVAPTTDAYAAPAPPPPPAAPPAAPAASDWVFAFHGIVGASFYVQDNPTFVLNGQGPLLLLAPRPTDGGFTTGADIRQSRFNLSLAGPKVLGGAVPKAVFEMDLFGLNGTGGYGEVSAYSRVRLAYAELKWENDMVRFGQDHQLILGVIPEGLGHCAYPVVYWAGSLGWREPGIGYFHTIPFGGESKLELALQVMKSDWQNPTDFGQPTTNDLDVDLGQFSGYPGVEARVKYSSEHLMAFVAGHWNHVQASHAGDNIAPYAPVAARNFDVAAGTIGVKLTAGGFSLLANAYAGQNTGPLLGEQLQFFTSADVFEYGGWLQALYAITPHLNVSAIGGTSQLNTDDVKSAATGDAAVAAAAAGKAAPTGAAARLSNAIVGGMVRYQEGGFSIGPEFHHVIATQLDATNKTVNLDGNQFMLSGMYFF
jgi:hypothetical protein